MRPLTVYSVIPYRGSASFYYRLSVPLETASDLGLPVRVIIDRNDSSMSPQDRVNAFCEADVVLLYQPVGDQPTNNIRGVQSFIPTKRDGEWKWPPSVVIDSDDNLFNVSPLNQAFRTLGIRDMNGNMIPVGHHIGVMSNGEKKILWKDGENDFDISRNRYTIQTYKNMLEMADAITCSTPGVESAIRKELSPRRTAVFSNLVRMDHYEQVDVADEPDKIKILWQGGIAHYEDWFPLRDALGHISAKYPQVHWIIWGAQFPWVKELIPAHRWTFKPWCHYHEYKLRLAMIGHDISLAPLASHVFNDCRSAIKFYESSVLKKPAATLAQNTASYKRDVIDGETGLLFNDPDEFVDKLSLLIEDTKKRKELAANAKDWVSENRDAMKEVPRQVAFWESLREDRKREQPHVSDAQWEEIEREAKEEEEALAGKDPDGTVHQFDAAVG